MKYLVVVWTLLNTSLISSIIGGIFAGLTVGIILYLWTGNKDQNKRLDQIKKLLESEINENLQTIANIQKFVNTNTNQIDNYTTLNNPLRMSSIKVAASESYLQAMEPYVAILVITLNESSNQLNKMYNDIKYGYEGQYNKLRWDEKVNEFPDSLSSVKQTAESLKKELNYD